MNRRPVFDILAAIAVVETIVLIVLVVLWSSCPAALEAFEGSDGFLMTSEPADVVGSDPYLDLDDRRNSGAPDGEVALTTDPTFGLVGTYGGTLAETCDVGVLIAHLTQVDADAGRRWATAAGIAPAEVAGFLSGLRSSALVDAEVWQLHGDGDAGVRVSRSALLDAGTAVLVDADGVAKVRCLGGNPLTPSIDVAEVTTSAITGTTADTQEN